jgi:hypothetical protein
MGTGWNLDPDPHRSTLICFSWIRITVRFGSTDLDPDVTKFEQLTLFQTHSEP